MHDADCAAQLVTELANEAEVSNGAGHELSQLLRRHHILERVEHDEPRPKLAGSCEERGLACSVPEAEPALGMQVDVLGQGKERGGYPLVVRRCGQLLRRVPGKPLTHS